MRGVLTLSLYNNSDKYLTGAIRNAELALRYYPDCKIWFYVGKSVPESIRNQLSANGAILIDVFEREDHTVAMWRFRAFYESDADYILVQDADSRFSEREAFAVREWLQSGKTLHIMRDHPYHHASIMAGMWGARRSNISAMIETAISTWQAKDEYGDDQNFLANTIYSRFANDAKIHARFHDHEHDAHDFTITRNGLAFVGEVVDAFEQRVEAHRLVLQGG